MAGLPNLGSKKKTTSTITDEVDKRLELNLVDIFPDPDQPRDEFDEDELHELAEDIRIRGVKSPISVKKHPTKKNKYMINHGERRVRASELANKLTVPAFLDDTHNYLDQISENTHRSDLTPMQISFAIKKLLSKKVKKKDIAQVVNIDQSDIAHYLALLNLSDIIESVYRDKRCRSARSLHNLQDAYDDHPAEVEEWCNSDVLIGRSSIEALKLKLENNDTENESSEDTKHDEKMCHDTENEPSEDTNHDEKMCHDTENDQEPLDNSEAGLSSWPKGSAVADPQRMTKPLLIVEYDERFAAIILNKKPTAEGFVYIQYQDNGAEEEVNAANCVINRLYEP